jgi:hypothetical protein
MKKSTLKKTYTPLKKGKGLRKSKPKTKEQKEESEEQRRKDLLFYNKIWNSRPRKCFETGEQLWGFSTAYFHHVLEKETHPEYRYLDENVILVSLDTHNQVHNHPRMCPKILAYKEQLITKLDAESTNINGE